MQTEPLTTLERAAWLASLTVGDMVLRSWATDPDRTPSRETIRAVGYYCFLDGEWIGRNGHGRLPKDPSAALKALRQARDEQRGLAAHRPRRTTTRHHQPA